MVDIFAVTFEGRVYLLFAEVQSISPVDISIFHKQNVGIITVILGLEEAVVEARVGHQNDVIEVEWMGDCMFV